MKTFWHLRVYGAVERCVASLLSAMLMLAFSSRGAELFTDQPDYPPGATAAIMGSGFQPGEIVNIQLSHSDATPASGRNDGPWQAVADQAGNFSESWVVCQEDCPGATLVLNAAGESSGQTAQTTFSVHPLPMLPSPFVLTDKSDYPPHSTAHIIGSGFQPGETVVLQVLHADGNPTGDNHAPWSMPANANGGIQTTWYVCEECLGASLRLSASGQLSGLSAEVFFTDACASSGGELDPTFDPGSAINNTVQSVVLQPDGKVLIGGLFTTVNNAIRSKIARVNPDGSTDFTFMNGMAGVNVNGEVYSVALQPDGKVIIGGFFSSVNGAPRVSIARLNPDGSTDLTFLNGLPGVRIGGSGGSVFSVVVQLDGKVVIGGQFTSVNGTTRNNIARLNPDGSLDMTFQNGMAGVSSIIRSVALQLDGKVLIGGQFLTVNGDNRNRIARLNPDGSTDSTFLNGPSGADQTVFTVAVQPDGRVLIGGAFGRVNGIPRGRVARLNPDGSLDPTFQNGMTGVSSGQVLSLVRQLDGKVVIVGSFTAVNGFPRNSLARLHSDGSLDMTFQNGMAGVPIGGFRAVHSVAVQLDGRVLIGGEFTAVNNIARHRLARLHIDGSSDVTFENGPAGPDNFVNSVALQTDGKVLIGGAFQNVQGATRNDIARLNADGSLDTTFQNGMTGANSPVQAVAVQVDGKVLIGGIFTGINGVVRNRFARLNADGSVDLTFQDPAVNVTVRTMAVQSDGKTLIGGDFSSVGGPTRNRIARLNADGSLDTTFQNGMVGFSGGSVFTVALQSDGKVLVGGNFTSVNGVPRRFLTRLETDGSTDTTFLNGLSGPSALVRSVTLQSDGKVLIGGDFSSVNTSLRSRIARLESNGAVDTTFQTGPPNGPNNVVQSVGLQTDGKVLLGGFFNLVSGVARSRIARLNNDGSLDTTFQNGMSGANSEVNSVVVQSDGKVLIGGAFTSVNDVPRDRVARLGGVAATAPPTITCPPDAVVECGGNTSPAFTGVATGADACGGPVVITFSDGPMSDGCGNTGSFTRTWTATDSSGQTATCTQTITVVDRTRPTILCPPNATVECGEDTSPSATGSAPGSDTCGSATITHSDGPMSDGCGNTGSFTRRWTATDECGNVASCDQVINVVDTTRPTITCPAPVSPIECPATPVFPAPAASDACDPNPTLTFNDVTTPGACPEEYTVTRTWTATDACGNSASCSQTVVVEDNTPPTIRCPANITVQCMEQVPTPDSSAVITSDNCSDRVIVLWESDVQSNPDSSCNNVITRTYRATDECGNRATCTQTITVNDTTPPLLSGCPPATASAQCLSQVPAPTAVTASDDCDGSVPVQFTETESNPGSSCNNVITRTWTAMDACGNTSSCSQTITVNDTTAPVLSGCPPSTVYQCFSEVPAPATVTANDNCGGTTPVQFRETQSNPGSSCNNVITRTWTATDACGNSASCSQTIAVNDTTPPVITCPANATVVFGSLPPAATSASEFRAQGGSIADNCDADPSVTSSDTTQGACPMVITRTYTVTDECGNSSTCQQIITVDNLFAADGIIWHQPLARNGASHDTDPSAGGTVKYRFQAGKTIPVQVHVLDCDGASVSGNANVIGTVSVMGDLNCDGAGDVDLPVDFNGVGGAGGAMDKVNGHLKYNLDTSSLPQTTRCYVLRVTVTDTSTGETTSETVLLQRR